jgi:predicted acylesterase/phospholipase RssA
MARTAQRRSSRRQASPKVDLALQGGGSHGAFTWGVLDALLEDGRLHFDGITGASAGAMNAVVLAEGWRRGKVAGDDPRAAARAHLRRFWEGVAALPNAFAPAWLSGDLAQGGAVLLDAWSRWFSPYQVNPFDYNPLRNLLAPLVDFAALREASPYKLFVCATNVRSGRARVFRDHELTCDMLLASAALPTAFRAVEIEGESYWDGGYMGNPALYPLFYATRTAGHQLRRVARPGDRLRDRRLPAGAGAGGADIQPDLDRRKPGTSRHVTQRREGTGRDPVRRVRGPHHRHADRAADPQRGPAQQGLRRPRRHLPPRPRRLHLLAQVRPARSARRRALVGAADRADGGGRRHREEVAARAVRHAIRGCMQQLGEIEIPFESWDEDRRAIRSSRRTRRSCRARGHMDAAAQARRLGAARASRGREPRRAGRAWASRCTTSSMPTSPTR